MTLDFPHASLVEGVRFTAQVGVPNVALGLFRRRPLPSQVAAAARSDQLAYQLIHSLVRKYGPDPFYVRVARDEALLVHHPDDIKLVLGDSPDPFASDPEPKRKGMAAFQPDALTISRGDLWRSRRAFTEAVLGAGLRRQAERFLVVVTEESELLRAATELRWADLNAGFWRITRRVVLGDSAADDVALTAELAALMSAANRMPGSPATGYDAFLDHVAGYVDAAEPGSLCALVSDAPATSETNPAGQLVHWLFAMGDTLAANVFRTLAVLATHPLQLAEVRAELDGADLSAPKSVAELDFLAGCLLDTMRLWPTTTMFARVTTRDVRFPTGALLPADTQVLIHNGFNHRNRDRVPFADRFAPEEWARGGAGSDWSFNFFSHGPQGCPGADLALLLGQAFVAAMVTDRDLHVSGARLQPGKSLPYTLDLYNLVIRGHRLAQPPTG